MEEEFENQFSKVAVLLGDKARALMLWHLLDGRSYTAMELSTCADISAQSTSNHLTKMLNAKIIAVEKQGRHRYYRFANPEIAQVIESMASLIPLNKPITKPKQHEFNEFVYARTCYDHLAGKIGVGITESLTTCGIIQTYERDYIVTSIGKDWFQSIGINVDEVKHQKRSFAHQCLDWSERKHHMAGALGAALLNKMLENDWIRRRKNIRFNRLYYFVLILLLHLRLSII